MTQELERGDSSIRSFASVQSGLVMYPIFTFGSEEQKDFWLPKLATGDAIGCFGLTEPDFGSNPGGMITRAEKKNDTYILNGAKMGSQMDRLPMSQLFGQNLMEKFVASLSKKIVPVSLLR